MTLRPLATRVPKETESEIREVMDYQNMEKAEAVRMILEIGITEWRKRIAIDLLREGKVTFARAAKMAKLDVWDFADLVKERKVEWIKADSGELESEAKKAAKAIRE
jgi:predicted HTH domain antitoxin